MTFILITCRKTVFEVPESVVLIVFYDAICHVPEMNHETPIDPSQTGCSYQCPFMHRTITMPDENYALLLSYLYAFIDISSLAKRSN